MAKAQQERLFFDHAGAIVIGPEFFYGMPRAMREHLRKRIDGEVIGMFVGQVEDELHAKHFYFLEGEFMEYARERIQSELATITPDEPVWDEPPPTPI